MNNLLAVGNAITSDAMITAIIQGVIGFLVTFVGIIILIAILTVVGKIMSSNDERARTKKGKSIKLAKSVKKAEVKKEEPILPVEEEIPDEVKAAIVAAIMAYYTEEKPKASFVVKRIKRI